VCPKVLLDPFQRLSGGGSGLGVRGDRADGDAHLTSLTTAIIEAIVATETAVGV
jgi:hypothetical protein